MNQNTFWNKTRQKNRPLFIENPDNFVENFLKHKKNEKKVLEKRKENTNINKYKMK